MDNETEVIPSIKTYTILIKIKKEATVIDYTNIDDECS